MIRAPAPALSSPSSNSPLDSSSPLDVMSPLNVRSTYTPYDDMDVSESLSVSKSRQGKKVKKFIPKTSYSESSDPSSDASLSGCDAADPPAVGDSDIYTFDMLDTAGTRALYDQVTFLTTPPSNDLVELCDLLCERKADVHNGGLLPAVLSHLYTYERDVGEGEDFLAVCCLLAVLRDTRVWRNARKGTKGWKWVKQVLERTALEDSKVKAEAEVKAEEAATQENAGDPNNYQPASNDPTRRGRSKKRRLKATNPTSTLLPSTGGKNKLPSSLRKLYPALTQDATTTTLALFAVNVLMGGPPADENDNKNQEVRTDDHHKPYKQRTNLPHLTLPSRRPRHLSAGHGGRGRNFGQRTLLQRAASKLRPSLRRRIQVPVSRCFKVVV